MASHVLVVATVTAASDDLLAALRERAARGPVDFLLVMPATGPGLAGRRATEPRLQEALDRWREAGLRAEGVAGPSDPVDAVDEVCSPGRFDEVIVSTLPGATSRWLRSDVPYRIGALTDLPGHARRRDEHGAELPLPSRSPPAARARPALAAQRDGVRLAAPVGR